MIENADMLQRRYRAKRRRWAWSIGRPYSEDLERPPPGEIDAGVDDETLTIAKSPNDVLGVA